MGVVGMGVAIMKNCNNKSWKNESFNNGSYNNEKLVLETQSQGPQEFQQHCCSLESCNTLSSGQVGVATLWKYYNNRIEESCNIVDHSL